MNHFSIVLNSQLNHHHVSTNVGVGLLTKIRINLFNIVLTKNLRPTLCYNQQSVRYAKNTYTSIVATRVGLKQISNYFVNGSNILLTTRPTPTLINAKRNILL
jgi:hypothetical protein